MAWRNKEEEKLERREEQNRREQQGGGNEPGEKQKRSWKEIDAKRDGARGRSGGDERPRPAKGESPAYRNYKSRLDKLFDGQIKMNVEPEVEVVRAPEKPKPAAAPAPAPAPSSLSPKDRLKSATEEADVQGAARDLLAAGGLPTDAECLLKVLSQSDASLYLPALETLLDAMEKGRPKNAKLIVARLDVLLPSLTADAADLAKGIRSRLG